MAKSTDFFDYFPVSPKLRSWGVYSTSFGKVRVPAGTTYPPARHPGRHNLDWAKGRVLSEYQILFIRKGQGSFESAFTKPKKIAAPRPSSCFPAYGIGIGPTPKSDGQNRGSRSRGHTWMS